MVGVPSPALAVKKEPGLKRVLIVDEDEHVRYSFRRILAGEYEILESGSGEEALSKVAASRPDLVVMDLRMPRKSDLQIFERMRELTPELPIIVMSSYGNEEAKRKVLGLGAYSFVLKPFNIEELRKLVSQGLGHTSSGISS